LHKKSYGDGGLSTKKTFRKISGTSVFLKSSGKNLQLQLPAFFQNFFPPVGHPIVFENDCLTFSMVGDPEDFNTFVKDAAEKGWGLEILSVCDYHPHVDAILDVLTPKQKEILLESYRRGFFEHPRRINAGELAEKMGMHKTTLLEHIHKAEKRLIGHILEQAA
jgi:hypothetical protein